MVSQITELKVQKLQDQLEFKDKFQRMVIHDMRGPSLAIQSGANAALQKIKHVLQSNYKQSIRYSMEFVRKEHPGQISISESVEVQDLRQSNIEICR